MKNIIHDLKKIAAKLNDSQNLFESLADFLLKTCIMHNNYEFLRPNLSEDIANKSSKTELWCYKNNKYKICLFYQKSSKKDLKEYAVKVSSITDDSDNFYFDGSEKTEITELANILILKFDNPVNIFISFLKYWTYLINKYPNFSALNELTEDILWELEQCDDPPIPYELKGLIKEIRDNTREGLWDNEEWNKELSFINGLKPKADIFRIFPIHRFFEMVSNDELTLVSYKKWDDPLENILKNLTVQNNNTTISFYELLDCVLGQCWSIKPECDGLWKNFASIDSGVSVQVNAMEIFDALTNQDTNKFNRSNWFIGRVKYYTREKLKTILPEKLGFVLDSTGKELAATMLLKQDAFSYEKEVRIIWNDRDKNFQKKGIASFKIPCKKLIKKITFAPKTPICLYNIYKLRLISLGYAKNIIQRSDIYDTFNVTMYGDFL